MAKSIGNYVVDGASGRMGNLLVFRQAGGKTIIAQRAKPSEKAPSGVQKSHRRRFIEASKYAKEAMLDPGLKAQFIAAATGLNRPHSVAVAHYFKELRFVNGTTRLGNYTGEPGNVFKTLLNKELQDLSVSVQIIDPSGTVVETGKLEADKDTLMWTYTLTTSHEPSDKRILFKATDYAGNSAELELTV